MNIRANPVRGVTRVMANGENPNAVLSELGRAFAQFRERHEQAIDDVNARLAALRVGSAGQGDDSAPRAALEHLGQFAKTGVMPKARMATDEDPKGGYLVPAEMDRNITRRQADLSPMRRLASVRATAASVYEIPMQSTSAGAAWVSERAARPETESPNLALRSFPTHELYANPAVTQALLDDAAVDVGAFLSEEIAVAFDELEGAAFVDGDGVGKPRGFLSYPKSDLPDADRDRAALQFVETESASVIGPDDLVNLLYALRSPYRAGSAWVMNSATAGAVRKMKDGDGNLIWSLATGPGELPMLLGYPVETDEGMPDIGDGKFPIAFGNFRRGYIIVDRLGIRVLRDPYTSKPNVLFYTTKRVGGGVHEANAIKLLKIKAS